MPSQYQTKEERYKILPGYPWEGKFKTREEVEKYFSGDKIQCLICGKWYKSLGTHIKIHNISVYDYKKKYGLPFSIGICSCATKEKHRDQTIEKISNGILNPWRDSKKAREKHHLIKKYTKPPKYFIEESKKRFLKIYDRDKEWEAKDYKEILRRMKEQERLLKDVYSDADVPGFSAWALWIKKHPEYKRAADKIHDGFPYSLQAKGNKMGATFRKECKKLSENGLSQKRIGNILGVSQSTVGRALKGINGRK